MARPVSRFTQRFAYGAQQLPRVAWYAGHAAVMRRLAELARAWEGREETSKSPVAAPAPDRRRLYQEMLALFQRDLANVEAGIYPLPADHDGPLPALLNRSRLFFGDLPAVHR